MSSDAAMAHAGLLTTTLIIAGLAAASVQAQEYGRPRRGHALALDRCAACHAVDRGQMRSQRADAPAFEALAAQPGMTETALLAALQTSHRTMPNLILEPDDKRDVIAYILSLRKRR
jgi:mono/diheme cytochrome c family protein